MEQVTYKDYNYGVQLNGSTMLPNQYIALIDELQKKQPKRICQFGCGQTTVIFQQYCQKYSDIIFYSIDHNRFWARKNTILFNLYEDVNITIADKSFDNISKYNGFEEWLMKQDPFDFICIDGPCNYGYRELFKYGRIQLLSFILLDKIAHNSIVLFHDSQRTNQIHTAQEFQKILKQKQFNFQKIIIPSQVKNNPAQLSIYKIS